MAKRDSATTLVVTVEQTTTGRLYEIRRGRDGGIIGSETYPYQARQVALGKVDVEGEYRYVGALVYAG